MTQALPDEPNGLMNYLRSEVHSGAHGGWLFMAANYIEALRQSALAFKERAEQLGVENERLQAYLKLNMRCDYLEHREAEARAEAMAKRLNWLHSPASSNVDGYEWGIYRVKWENGRAIEVWQTNSDFSDLDAALDAHKGTGL